MKQVHFSTDDFHKYPEDLGSLAAKLSVGSHLLFSYTSKLVL